ncbi:MAG TPA: ChbG/HpnK family deacetylase [Anaerolineae bacterium]|nr:ChbG/HpnK family deacetylase [Anaerolineae bacterium]
MKKIEKLNRRDFLLLGGLAAGSLTAGRLFGPSSTITQEASQSSSSATSSLAGSASAPQPIDNPFPQETTLPPNPLLEKLGFSKDDRILIVHVDDVGMCQANVEGFSDLVDFGLISTGSVMVPCAWFSLAAHYARTHPEADLGIHLVLTSEWENIRWSPVSTTDHASGLIDAEGYFYNNGDEVTRYAKSDAAYEELETQILMALEAGIDLTHADAHQFVAMMPTFLLSYLRLTRKYMLPPLFQRKDRAGWESMPGMDPEMLDFAVLFTKLLSTIGVPMVDNYFMMPMEQPEYRLEITKQVLEAVPPGINELIIHATKDSPEIREITPDWKGRVADYTTWMSEDLRSYIERSGIKIIGWRPIRDAVRS